MNDKSQMNDTNPHQGDATVDNLRIENFKNLCELAKHYNDKLTEALTFHITTLSAICGGSIWLAVENKISYANQIRVASLADALVILLTLTTIARITGNLRGWYRARWAQKRAYDVVPPPHWLWSTAMEIFLALSVVVTCLIFVWANPFISLNFN